jgi:hypothetical protein
VSGKFIVELTISQRMAMTDALVEHIRCPNSTERFVDCSEDPAVETTISDLLRLLTDAKYIPAEAERVAAHGMQSDAMLNMLGKNPKGEQ